MKRCDQKTITVVVPLFNHEKYIEDALNSVLQQTRLPDEIVVIDDGSKDNSFAIAEKALRKFPNKTVITQTNKGTHHTLNRCIELAKSDYIAILNSDDLFKTKKIERCMELLDENPELEMIFGVVDLIDGYGEPIKSGETWNWLSKAYDYAFSAKNSLELSFLNENIAVTTSNLFFSKRIWLKNGKFANLRYCHDLEFCFEALQNGIVKFDQYYTHIDYRVHATNTIKENIATIRLEVAAVIVNALYNNFSLPSFDKQLLSFFNYALHKKGFGVLLSYIVARRGSFLNKEQYYLSILEELNGLPDIATFNNWDLNVDGNLEIARNIRPSIDNEMQLKNDAIFSGINNRISCVVIELFMFDKGGLEKVVLDTAIYLKKLGIEAIIVSCRKIGLLGEVARENGITVYELSQNDALTDYEKILDQYEFQLSISHFSRTGYPLFKKRNIPNVTFIHNVYAFLDEQKIEEIKSDDQHVDLYISVSKSATDYCVQKFGLRETKIRTIPNGLNINEHVQKALEANYISRASLNLEESDCVFLNVASYNLHKNHYLMADAMKLILKKTKKIKILCVGNTVIKEHIDGFREYLFDQALENHIQLAGYYEDVAPLHAISDFFLLPSLIEGWSIAMNEAVFFNKPLLMTDTGGAKEIVERSGIGIIIPNEYGDISNLNASYLDQIAYNRRKFNTAPYLANAMYKMYLNKDEWKERARIGNSIIRKEYNFDKVIRQYLNVFSEVANLEVGQNV